MHQWLAKSEEDLLVSGLILGAEMTSYDTAGGRRSTASSEIPLGSPSATPFLTGRRLTSIMLPARWASAGVEDRSAVGPPELIDRELNRGSG